MTRYRLDNVLGRGGMGIVYAAWEIAEDRSETPVVIKRLLPEYSDNPAVVARFCQEAKLSQELSHGHDNLVTVHHVGRDSDGHLFIAMERLSGLSLDRLAAAGELSTAEVRHIVRETASALAYLHDRGVLHRDVSPRNVLVTRDGAVKLLDLGLAKIRDTPMSDFHFKGTAAFASPEALYNVPLGPDADLYSLAAVAYYLITGEPPYGFGEVPQLVRRTTIRQVTPLADTVPKDLRGALMGLLRFVDERKPRDAPGLLAMLDKDAPGVAGELGQRVAALCAGEQGPAVIEAAECVLEPLELVELKVTTAGQETGGKRSRWPAVVEPVVVLALFLLAVVHEPPAPGVATTGTKESSHEVVTVESEEIEVPAEVVEVPVITPVEVVERAPADPDTVMEMDEDTPPTKRTDRHHAAKPKRPSIRGERDSALTLDKRQPRRPWNIKR